MKTRPLSLFKNSQRPAAFRSLLMIGLALLGLNSLILGLFIWKASKTFKSEERFENADGSDFQEENSSLYVGTFKGLSPSTTPLEREGLVRIIESTIHLIYLLSIS
jgi:hypothetical protein